MKRKKTSFYLPARNRLRKLLRCQTVYIFQSSLQYWQNSIMKMNRCLRNWVDVWWGEMYYGATPRRQSVSYFQFGDIIGYKWLLKSPVLMVTMCFTVFPFLNGGAACSLLFPIWPLFVGYQDIEMIFFMSQFSKTKTTRIRHDRNNSILSI